jgi:hypothetical protein
MVTDSTDIFVLCFFVVFFLEVPLNNSLVLDFSRVCGMVVYEVEKSTALMLYQYLIIGRDKSYSAKSHSKSNDKYKEDEII